MDAHSKGQPVLVGTITIEASEELSALLNFNIFRVRQIFYLEKALNFGNALRGQV